MAHKHSVYDTDSHFIINPITRAIKNDSSSKVLLMQYDHNSERFTFEIDKLVDGHDMSKCSTIQVHYINIDSTTKATTKGLYEVNDMQLSPDSDNKVIFSWLISQNATNYAGQLNFLIKFICINEEDKTTIEYQWHSSIYTGISISNGMNNSESVVEEYADVLETWKKELIEAGTLTDEDIEKAVNSYMDKNPVSLDYNDLKNKPFYNEELSRSTVVSQITLTGFSKWQDGLYGKGSTINYTLQDGAFYDVTFDGKLYENLKCFLDEEDLTIGAPYGNFSIYPFGIYQDNTTLGFFTNSTSSSHLFKIDKVEKNLKYIDDAVIPNTIARVNQIPTKTSQLENDSNFLTQHQDISGKQDKLVSGENIKTINGTSLLGSGDIEIQGGGSNVVDLTKTQTLTDEEQATVRKNISAVKVWLSEDGTTLFIDSGGVVKTVPLNNSTPINLGEFIEIANITTEEEVQEVAISVDSDGQPFETEELILICAPHSSTTNTTQGPANLGYTFSENGVVTKKDRLNGLTGKSGGAERYIYCGTDGKNNSAFFATSAYIKRLSKETMMIVTSCCSTSGDSSLETRDKYLSKIGGQEPRFEIVKCYGKITEIKIQNHWNNLNMGVGTRIILLEKK